MTSPEILSWLLRAKGVAEHGAGTIAAKTHVNTVGVAIDSIFITNPSVKKRVSLPHLSCSRRGV